MKSHCIHGHPKTSDNIIYVPGKRGYWKCRVCRAAERRRHRQKKSATGRWWEIYTVRSLSVKDLRRLAYGLAHGMTLTEIASEGKNFHGSQFFRRWSSWKHSNPKVAKRFLRLSRDTASERRQRALLAKKLVAPVYILTEPPSDMWAIIDSIVPRRMFPELRAEVCQQLAVEVLERRCECTVEGLSKALSDQQALYFREYANPWGNRSLNAYGRGDYPECHPVILKSES